MSFKFNFGNNDGVEDEQNEVLAKNKEQIIWMKSELVVPNKDIVNKIDDIITHAKMFTCNELEIGHVGPEHALKIISLQDSCVNEVEAANKGHSDLVTGKYEGGLKIWECTYDLVEYLMENKDNIKIDGANVLDLGCGAGILGIYAFINNANVTFQDYNKEVLDCLTIPNVLLNIEEDKRSDEIKKCKFYSGDWALFDQLLPENETYDLIVTSETIYNERNYSKLIDLFVKRLSPDGTIYLAAKSCYFGVGGGVKLFLIELMQNDNLSSEVCWKNSNGIQREILKIKKTNKSS